MSGRAPSALIIGARRGLLASMVDQLGTVASTVVLARLLTPDDFGVIAAATTVVGLLSLLSQLGIGSYVLIAPEASRSVLSTAIWAATAAGLLLATTGALLSGTLARAISVPSSGEVIALMMIGVVFTLPSTVPRNLLLRRQEFRSMYTVQNLSTVAYVGTAIGLASLGEGASAIGWAFVAQAVVRCVGNFLAARLLPDWRVDLGALRAMTPFTGGSLLLTFAAYGAKNIDNWTLGHVATTGALGLYYVAYVAPSLVRTRLTGVVGDVGLSALVALRTDSRAFQSRVMDTLHAVFLVGLPAMVGLAVASHDVLQVGFGERWVGATTAMQILCFAAAADLAFQVGSNSLYARAAWPSVLGAYGVRVAVAAGVLILLVPTSDQVLLVTASAMLVSSVVGAATVLAVAGRAMEARVRPFWAALRAPLIWSMAMGAVAWACREVVPGSPVVRLLATVLSGLATYWAVTFLLLPSEGRRSRNLLLDSAGLRRRRGNHAASGSRI